MNKINSRIIIVISVIAVTAIGFLLYIIYDVVDNNENKKIISTKDIPKEDTIKKELSVIGFISPHHLVADDMIDEIFSSTAQANQASEIDRIVLVSPNHFHAPGGLVMISDKNWPTEHGEIVVDKKLAKTLQNIDEVYINNKSFVREHGIQGLLPFVQQYFEGVPVLPMMIELNTSKDIVENIAEVLVSEKNVGNTLIILSSDFSHELTPHISELHDKAAISAIEHFDFEKVYDLETDCVEGLYMLMKFAQLKGYDDFQSKDNSNSSEKYNNFFIGENTSYVTGQFTSRRAQGSKDRTVSLLFGGDVMLDRVVRQKVGELGVPYFTQKINKTDASVKSLSAINTNNTSY